MKILIACEFSGIVRDAFKKRGHDAWSCDLLPTEKPGNHIQGDVLEILNNGWDLMIAHPPCERLTIRGQYWNKVRGLEKEKEDSINFFMSLYNAKIRKVCIENPIGIMSTIFRKPNQYINPFEYGHQERKKTCLWTRGLLNLKSTNEVKPEEAWHIDSKQKRYWMDRLSKTPDRWKIKSRTFQGIANAMAEQWR